MTKHLMIGAACTAVLGLSSAHAAAVYSAEASTTLTLVSVSNQTTAGGATSGLEFAVSTNLAGEGGETDGDATARTDVTLEPNDEFGFGLIRNSLTTGNSVRNAGGVFGEAIDGSSEAFVSTGGDLVIENLSATETFEVSFELSYAMFASAAVDDLGTEEARARSFVEIEGFFSDGVTASTLSGGVSTVISDLLIDLSLDTDTAAGELSEAATLVLTFVLEPGAFVEMFMLADVLGNSFGVAMDDVNPVPVPPALAVMGLGLAGLGAARRRKAKADA